MKTKRKNQGLLLLMVSSLLLLLAFQFLWLKEAYQKQRDLLTEQTDNLFIKTVRNMQDSLTNKLFTASLENISGDSSFAFFKMERQFEANEAHLLGGKQEILIDTASISTVVFRTDDSVQINWEGLPLAEHRASKLKIKTQKEVKQRVPRFLQNIILSVTANDSLDQSLFPLQRDSLALDSLDKKYANALFASGIDLSFTLNRVSISDKELSLGKELITSQISGDIPEDHLYYASFPNSRQFLLQKIAPDILLSILLTFLTTLSFVLVFQNMKKQQRLTALKNDLISNITHELKTPITTVGVAIEALSSFDALKNPIRTKEYLEISRNELKRLSILVDKVLKTALFGEEEMELKLEKVDLKQLINEILNSMKLQFEKFTATIQFTVEGQSFMVNADRIHLTSVIYNLLDNALKYGSLQPSIAVDLALQNDKLQLKVKDNGIGIPAEFKDKIFEKFFRVPTGDQHDIKGHGLGLNYVANVIRRHHGNIAVESEPGKGSIFTIKLPVDDETS